ncbi:hypothetical protein [Amycolatopsis mediterranei]|uniref:Uncharacterized protein n=1 Tax=Amycolatopsis mediterranei (strain S699) TaxID=713604 RepID=A0A9R0NT31_AMYMS|nr:hypothetical protein RAM_08185 [Amycolatopsis mediterranei S699]
MERRTAGEQAPAPLWQDRGMSTDAPVTPVTRGSFWRRRTIDLLLVASAGCTRARFR